MEILIPIIAILGLFIGKLIGYMASDEIKPGMPYFFVSKRIILFILLVLMAINMDFSMVLGFAGLVGFIVGYAFKFNYLWLGFAMLASLSGDVLAVGALIFMYGLIHGSLEKSWLKETIMFLVPLSLLWTPISTSFIAPFVIGALLVNLVTNAN